MRPLTNSRTSVRLMLQNLLADRFQLALHKEMKPLPAFALVAGNGKLKLKESDGSGDTGCKFTPPPPAPPNPGGPPPGPPLFVNSCTNMTMTAFAQALTTTIFLAQQYLNDRLVVDELEFRVAAQRRGPQRAERSTPMRPPDEADGIEDDNLRRLYISSRKRELA